MQLPIKYKLYNNRLWVRYSLDDIWKVVRTINAKILTPITQNFGNDFKWNKREPVNWYDKWFYKEILNIPGHNGIDFEAPTGTRLYAPHDGEITELMNHNGYGLRIKSKEYESIFLHLKDFHCNLNQEVKQGDFIALTDNTGRYTTAPHLHWGVKPINYQNDAYKGYMNFRVFIEDLDVEQLPYADGQCLIRTKANGEFYVVENGDLVYKASDKQTNRHIPIIDFFLKQKKNGLPSNFIKDITEEEFIKFNNLIK